MQWAWDSTSLGYLKTCPRLYQYKMIEGWQEKDESVHLRFGIEYHGALQNYDKARATNVSHDDAVHDVIRALVFSTAEWNPDHKFKNREFLFRTVIWYLDKFEHDAAKTHIKSDGTPAVEESFRFELDWGPYTDLERAKSDIHAAQPYLLCGHLDKVVNFNDDLYVLDHKTTKSEPSSWYFTQYEPDNQMTLYTLAAQVIFQSPIKGVIVDAAQIAIGFSRFGRGFTYRTKEQIEEWLGDLKYLLAQAEDYAAEGYWPMNDKACNSYRSEESGTIGCPFRCICSKAPQVRGQFLKSGFTKLSEEDRWNPMKSR